MRSWLKRTIRQVAEEAAYRTLVPSEAQYAVQSLEHSSFTDSVVHGILNVAEDALYRAAPVVPAFSPLDLPGLEQWLRADLGVTVQNVSEWDDQSGANDPNRNFVATVVANQPTVNVSDPLYNDQATIDFASADVQVMFMSGLWSNAPISQPFTLVVVGNDDAIFNAHRPWVGDSNVNQWYMASFPNPLTAPTVPFFGSSEGTGIGTNLITTTVDAGQRVIYMSEFNDPSSTIRINEQSAEPLTQAGGGPPFSTDETVLGQLTLGGAFGTANTFNGKIAELVAFRGLLSPANKSSLLTYLSSRYDISVTGTPGTVIASPAALPGLQLWLRADMGVHASVVQWADQSGAGDPNRNVEQAVAVHQPILNQNDPAYNGQASISFSQSPFQFLLMAGLWSNAPITQPYTVIVVGNDGDSGSQVFVGDAGADNWYVTADAGFYGASVSVTLLGTTPDSITPKILMLEYNDPNSTIRVSEETVEATGNIGAGDLPQLEIGGAFGGAASPLSGKIVEFIVVRGLLSATDRVKTLTYLRSRYAISVGP